MTTRERREARAERLREWADKRETRSAADLERARAMASVIPFGQPIHVGHYSERSDRSYRARIGSTYDRAFESAAKADTMRAKAANIEAAAARSIYSDDDDATERLEERIADLEAERDAIKAANAAFRKAHRAELAAMSAYERDHALPHRGYELTNLSGNIKRNRDRLAVLKAQAERASASEAAGGVLVEQLRHGYARVTFAAKPERAVIDALKAAGYRWGNGSWTGNADALPAEVADPDRFCPTCGADIIGNDPHEPGCETARERAALAHADAVAAAVANMEPDEAGNVTFQIVAGEHQGACILTAENMATEDDCTTHDHEPA